MCRCHTCLAGPMIARRAPPHEGALTTPDPPPTGPPACAGTGENVRGPVGQDEGPGPVDRALRLPAVAVGFEPTVTCATLAFEASSFGRSDTLPRETLQHRGQWS